MFQCSPSLPLSPSSILMSQPLLVSPLSLYKTTLYLPSLGRCPPLFRSFTVCLTSVIILISRAYDLTSTHKRKHATFVLWVRISWLRMILTLYLPANFMTPFLLTAKEGSMVANVPHFHYSFISWGTFKPFLVSSCYGANSQLRWASISVVRHRLLWVYAQILWRTYLQLSEEAPHWFS